MYSKQDIANLDEIRQFLNDNDIEYSTEYDNFCLFYGTDHAFEIEYVPSLSVTVAYPRLGIPGVSGDYFYQLSKQSEEEHQSFKFWVKQFEWEDPIKKDILKSYIIHAAGKTSTRFNARNTEVKVFSNSEVKQFEIENCFYGFRAASLNLGLVLKKDVGQYKKGTLLMVTTFGRNFFSKRDDFVEIFRVGTLKYCQVIGGASKLFKHFLRNYPTLNIGKKEIVYKKVVYYVDYDHGAGKSIAHLGFTRLKDSGGGFMNYDLATNKASHRTPMQHKEVMKRVALGEVVAIPNAGVKTYEYVVDRTNFVPTIPQQDRIFDQIFEVGCT